MKFSRHLYRKLLAWFLISRLSFSYYLFALLKNFFRLVFFQDVLDSKNSAIKDLQYELARVCKVKNMTCLICYIVTCRTFLA